MSKQDPTDQVRFLVSCIGHTSNGRPDFQAVATELGIVSKAAAQKRYERMLKANGVTAKASANNGDDKNGTKTSPTKRKATGEGKGKKAPAKKVKSESEGSSESGSPVKKEEKNEEEDQNVLFDIAQPNFGAFV